MEQPVSECSLSCFCGDGNGSATSHPHLVTGAEAGVSCQGIEYNQISSSDLGFNLYLSGLC